jgi:thiol-disulfide isomerase/thioredoxin
MRTAAFILLLAANLSAAELRDVNEPAKIKEALPRGPTVRLVNIWATWCVPCVAEMPQLRAVAEAFGSEVSITGVSMDDMIPESTREKVIIFLDKQKITYPNLYYRGNADDLTHYFHFQGEIPITIAFDRAGREVWRHEGAIKSADTIPELRKLLGRMK